MNWHSLPIEAVYKELESNENGLKSSQVKEKLEKNGFNELEIKQKRTAIQMFFEQFKNVMIIILLIAAVVSAFVGELVDSAVIMILVLFNAILSTVQELKAEQSLEALKKMSAPQAKTIRDGVQVIIPARELTAGDIVILDTGDYVPADLRLTEFKSLKIQESALTGESVPVEKSDLLLQENASLADRVNMAYSSSLVTYGRGRGIVVGTGMRTEVGKIASMLQETEDTETPMQKRLESLGKTLGYAALIICGLIFLIGILYKRDFIEIFMTAVSLAVAAIPEGLPAISTVVLALGVQRMVKRNAIVRTLPSVETLGSATVICSDKTGTLTQNKMTVTKYAAKDYSDDRDIKNINDEDLIRAGVLCIDAKMLGESAIGDPTEIALLELGINNKVDKTELEKQYPRVAELPFDSDRKLMTTVHKHQDKLYVYTKGGLDELFAICSEKSISDADKDRIYKINESMATNALRVLAFGYKIIDSMPEDLKTLESELNFIGIMGMIDPPREEAKMAVAHCHEAGISPVMITGDHAITASAIAKELGILSEGGRVVTGAELEKMTDEELYNIVESISVYARVSPEHKVRIVDAWQKHNNIVAMTGDGVNDAPALKSADIGCAMGKVGTDVAKDSADLILVDDNFATIVSAIEEGRRIYDNILKTVSFLIACNVGELIVIFTATILNWLTPLLPIHILLVNLVTDGFPALALGVDDAEKDIMKRKAVKEQNIFSKPLIWRISYQGLMIGVLTLIAFCIGREISKETAWAMSFSVLALSQVAHSFNLHSNSKSIFSDSPFKNKFLIGASFISIAIVFSCLYIPGLNELMKLIPLESNLLFWVVGISIIPIPLVELMKLFKLNGVK